METSTDFLIEISQGARPGIKIESGRGLAKWGNVFLHSEK